MRMAGEHFLCYTYCADSLVHSMTDLLIAKPMKWTCSTCRHLPNTKMMDTMEPNCAMGCGHTGMDTLKAHVVAWLRAIMSTSGFSVDNDRTVAVINFSALGEKLLYPHGQARGMMNLVDHTPVSEDRTCACEVDTVTTTDTDGVNESSKSADSNPEVEEMDTAEKELPELGKEALLKKFSNSCKLEYLITMVSDGYRKSMLSYRLSGVEVKEGLCITVYLKHLVDHPDMSIPPILPKSVLDHSEEVLGERLTYLGLKSMRRTKAERAGAEMSLHAGVTKGMRKRKLPSDPKDDGLAPPLAKKPKLFTHSAAEMVKIVGQFVQATSNAGSDKKLNALKTMESILARSELSKKNQAEDQITESETAPAESVTAEPTVEEPRLAYLSGPPRCQGLRTTKALLEGRPKL